MSKIQGHCCQHIVTYIIGHKSLGTKISYKKGPMNIGTQIIKSNVDTRYIRRNWMWSEKQTEIKIEF